MKNSFLLFQKILFTKSLQNLGKNPAWGVRISRFDFRVLGAQWKSWGPWDPFLAPLSLCVGAEYGSQGVQLFRRCTPRALGRVVYGNVFGEPVLASYLLREVPVLVLYLLGVFKHVSYNWYNCSSVRDIQGQKNVFNRREHDWNEKGGGKVGELPFRNIRTDRSGVVRSWDVMAVGHMNKGTVHTVQAVGSWFFRRWVVGFLPLP